MQAFPQNRVKRLLLALKASLGRGTGAPLTFDDWGEMVGRPGNTLASWCADGEAHQIQALLASLERLPKPDRHRMIDDACRLYPTLWHRRLAHDFVTVSELAALLRQATGFTAIQGALDHLRTFLLTALGNSFEGAGPVAGIDAHRPDGFVPVVGVSYPDDPRDAAGHVRRAWPDVRSTEASLILLNGVCGAGAAAGDPRPGAPCARHRGGPDCTPDRIHGAPSSPPGYGLACAGAPRVGPR